MLLISNRRLIQGHRSQAGRRVDFDLVDNEPQASVFFLRRLGEGVYDEITSGPFFDWLRRSPRKQILLYVHGYNTMPEDAMSSAAALQRGCDALAPELVQVVPVIWPCDDDLGLLRDYWDDQAAAEQSGLAFSRALRKLIGWREHGPNTEHKRSVGPCLKPVNILAHSMGNHVLRASLQRWFEGYGAMCGYFRMIFMAAADVANRTLETDQAGAVIAEAAQQVVVYHARDDLALRTSKAVNLKNRVLTRRLGHTGPDRLSRTPRNVTTVDCSAFNGLYDPLGHSYHGLTPNGGPGLLLSHMVEAMRTGKLPGREGYRRAIKLEPELVAVA